MNDEELNAEKNKNWDFPVEKGEPRKKEAVKEIQLAQPSMGLPSMQEFSLIKEQASIVLASGFLPKSISKPEQAIAIALKGRELGIPMMQAFSHIHIIEGKPTISAELMLALIYRNCPTAMIGFDKNDEHACSISAARSRGHAHSKFSFAMDDAKRAGVLTKSNWQKYPAAMLRARAISAMARAVFPDALMGCSYVPEEMGADTDDEGNVIDAASTKQPAQMKVVQQVQPKPQEYVAAMREPGDEELVCAHCNEPLKKSQYGMFCGNYKVSPACKKANKVLNDLRDRAAMPKVEDMGNFEV